MSSSVPRGYQVAKEQAQAEAVKTAAPAIRRRGNLQQGYALEKLGHAVEYLVDSRLFAQSEKEAKSDQEAIQLLMRMSRAVFLECPEVVPMRRRLADWFSERSFAARWLARGQGADSDTMSTRRH